MTHPTTEQSDDRRAPQSRNGLPRPVEATEFHTRILRYMLAVDDSYAYWQRFDPAIPLEERASVAFEQRWFGTKSEARVRLLVGDLSERFDRYREGLDLLHALKTIPSKLRPFICHIHTQLSDPIYRRFTGEFLPERRERGQTTIDRPTVVRWIDSLEPNRWSSATCAKFASNLLATSLEAGLISGRRDPRKTSIGVVPVLALGYLVYLLRNITIEGSLTNNPYLRSLGITAASFGAFAPSIPGIRYAELGGSSELVFAEPTLLDWGLKTIGAES